MKATSPNEVSSDLLDLNEDFLRKYRLLPRANSNVSLKCSMRTSGRKWSQVNATEATALEEFGVRPGNSIRIYLPDLIVDGTTLDFYSHVYAVGEIATSLIDLDNMEEIEFIGRTLYGVVMGTERFCADYNDPKEYEDLTGIVVDAVVSISG